ncbi:M23 family metallopeptidase [Nocardioides marmotae]|uniref:M23 family metallopeptidase n=1 Tax=Nocardioides marmotae TaxID=2663857 RepID=UPI0012B64FAD|nr:M23 family metallopeptidase [Nocardioides marmotae]MBC9733696.1 M23 family metallopeptidase [Nocardioides marmotae]MTB84799.1 peptidoglycan DD-metalloendopeptidase family protein [Nocardioides marmotae]
MGSHRAERRGPRRRPSETPEVAAGRRAAGRGSTTREALQANPVATAPGPAGDATTVFRDHDATVEMPLVRSEPGKRKAVKQAVSRGPRFRVLPSAPALIGAAALAVSVGGAVTTAAPDLAAEQTKVQQPSALGGASGTSSVDSLDRGSRVSRDSRRDALDDTADADLVAAAAKQMRQRNTALAKFAKDAEAHAQEIAKNQWVMPIQGYRLTARYGDYGLWANYHTGLDFAAPTGTPLVAVANATVTSAGYDGAYGNKTVLTLEDGTEIWYCHQTSMNVSPGDTVRAGEVIGTVGSTGHVTGPHLHLEVRPGAGDPVDPHAALRVHGLNP